MLAVLAPDAVRHVDRVLLPAGHETTVRGASTIVEEARSMSVPARAARLAMIDGRPGAAVTSDGVPTLVLTFSISDGVIHTFEVIADQHRLAGLTIEETP